MIRRQFGLGLLLAATLSAPAFADSYPSRPIKFIVPAAASGPTDLTARLLGEEMQKRLGQPIVVEPKPGAGGNIGADAVAKAAPDGYTLGIVTIGTHAINKTLYSKLPFDPVKDFQPITQIVQYPLILVVSNAVPAKDVRELMAYAKANPGKLSRASGGSGTSMHLSGELFASMANLNLPHVPYKGSAPALNDLVGGHADLMFDSMMTALPLVKAGKLRALAVTGKTRSPVVPDVPTIAESGLPEYSAVGWIGLAAPAGTPKEIVDKLHSAAADALRSPALRERLVAQAAEPVGSTPAEFAEFMKGETEKWSKAVRDSGAKVN